MADINKILMSVHIKEHDTSSPSKLIRDFQNGILTKQSQFKVH